MPSITYWNRLEPRPRAESLKEPLRAKLRDPLWLFARQWQMGEMEGADAGSPAHVEIAMRTGRLTQLRSGAGTAEPIGTMPIERQATAERVPTDLAMRIELGQDLAKRLGTSALRAAFRDAYSISRTAVDPLDPEELTLRRVCGGRSIDGVGVLEAARTASSDAVPASVSPGDRPAAIAAVDAFVAHVRATLGELGDVETGTWDAERLEHHFEVDAVAPDGRSIALSVTPGSDGAVDWHALDVKSYGATSAPGPGTVRHVLPNNVRFRGIPNSRFWDFEHGQVDFGGIDADRRDLGRLAVMEFMLLHSNDWFQLPLELPVGSVATIEKLVVHDVFGSLTVAGPTFRDPVPVSERFCLFASSREGSTEVANLLFVVPSGAAATLFSEPIEEVRFVRDETANMAWAIEHATPDAAGEGRPGREAEAARNPPVTAPAPATDASLKWTIMTTVPEHWIPLLPVAIDPSRGQIALERGAMLRPGSPPTPIEPRGRILRPSTLPGLPYRIREEQIPRVGIRVTRAFARARWMDGSTHLWLARKKSIGFGEADSALRFDTSD
jgi:hypothetical protein